MATNLDRPESNRIRNEEDIEEKNSISMLIVFFFRFFFDFVCMQIHGAAKVERRRRKGKKVFHFRLWCHCERWHHCQSHRVHAKSHLPALFSLWFVYCIQTTIIQSVRVTIRFFCFLRFVCALWFVYLHKKLIRTQQSLSDGYKDNTSKNYVYFVHIFAFQIAFLWDLWKYVCVVFITFV